MLYYLLMLGQGEGVPTPNLGTIALDDTCWTDQLLHIWIIFLTNCVHTSLIFRIYTIIVIQNIQYIQYIYNVCIYVCLSYIQYYRYLIYHILLMCERKKEETEVKT